MITCGASKFIVSNMEADMDRDEYFHPAEREQRQLELVRDLEEAMQRVEDGQATEDDFLLVYWRLGIPRKKEFA